MKILHLADLHIGKKVNDFCMLSEQEYVLNQACELIENEQIEAVLICGDVFDKPIPTISALELFDSFLSRLTKLKTKVFIISGNHDNMDRISYLGGLLNQSGVYVSKSYTGNISKIFLNENIDIYLMPYLYPALVKKYHPDKEINNYNDAIKAVVDNINIDKNKFNIILAHQFVLGGDSELVLSESEQKSVGGIDEISYKIFDKFDYSALGHLHCPQKCKNNRVYYAGSILKYSFSEINQKKKFCILEIDNNKKLNQKFVPINFLHEYREYRGYIDEFLNKEFYEKVNVNDYIHFTLLDESVIDAKKKLSLIYPNIMLLEFDNSYTRNLSSSAIKNIEASKTIYEHFCDFYKSQLSVEIDSEKKEIVKKILNEELECDQ